MKKFILDQDLAELKQSIAYSRIISKIADSATDCCSIFHTICWQGNRHTNLLKPALVASLKQVKERVVQISLTNSIFWNAHTFALTESGKLYAFGAGDKGQLGVKLGENLVERGSPELVGIDLSS